MRESAELGALLRHWRARVTPERVGLTAGPGRRVSGLRRQEVARLAGVSTDYLVQLEQGRSGVPSAQVLTALARALRLSPVERDHLLRMAGYGPPVQRPPEPSADVLRLVDQLGATPAAVYDICWQPVAWNPLWAAINGDPLAYPGRERSMMWRALMGRPSRVRRSAAEARRVQQVLVGDLRARWGQRPGDDRLAAFVDDLSAVNDRFRGMWEAHRIDAYRHEAKEITHPEAGTLHLDCDVLIPDNDDLRLIVYTARRRSESADHLERLHAATADDGLSWAVPA